MALFIGPGAMQSNGYGYADWNASGGVGAGTAGADFGFGINNTTSVFPAVTFHQKSSTSPSASAGTAQTYNITTGDIPLKAFAAAGTTNMGYEQSLGRALIEWGIDAAPYIAKYAIAGSSVPVHYAKLAAWGNIYTNWVAYAIASKTAAGGINPVACIHWIGETDSGTPSRVVSAPTDLKLLYDNFYADAGYPSTTPIIAMMINSAQSAGDIAGYRAAMLSWQAIDSRVLLIDMDDVPLYSDPHYGPSGQFTAGYRIAAVVAGLLGKTVRLPTAGSTTPFWRYDEPCVSCQSPVASQPRSGPDPRLGDVELLALWSYSAVVTHVLATAAGYTQIGTQVDSVISGTVHKAQSLYYRVLTASHFFTDASGRLRTLTPSLTIGSATLGIGKVIGTYRNVDPANPINAFAFGTQVTSGLTHTVPTITTTKAGCLVVIAGSDNGVNCSNSGLTNVALTSLTQRRDGRVNPGAGQVGYWTWDGVLPAAGSVGTSAATFTVASVVTSMAVALNPLPSITATGAIVGDSGATSGTAGVTVTVSSSVRGGHGTITGTAGVTVTAAGAVRGGHGTITGVAGAIITASGAIRGESGAIAGTVSMGPTPAPVTLAPKISATANGSSINFSPTLWQGESRVLTLFILDPDTGRAPDLVSAGKWQILTCEWQIKATLGAADPPLVSKVLGDIVLQGGGALGRIDIILMPADTADLAPGCYVHDLTATFAGGERLYLIKPSALPVLGVVNQL